MEYIDGSAYNTLEGEHCGQTAPGGEWVNDRPQSGSHSPRCVSGNQAATTGSSRNAADCSAGTLNERRATFIQTIIPSLEGQLKIRAR